MLATNETQIIPHPQPLPSCKLSWNEFKLARVKQSLHQASRLLVVGCGPAAKRNYFSLLDAKHGKEYEHIDTLVELESAKEDVNSFTSNLQNPPHNKIWLPEEYRQHSHLPIDLVETLDQKVAQGTVNGIMILTEPKAHLPYLRWAISRQLPILLEKPISAPIGACTDTVSAKQIWDDYKEIEDLLQVFPNSQITVMAQRRAHQGYQFIMKYLKQFVTEHQIPITFVDMFKSDGQWNFPHEYNKENHPYKYGYGMLLHGGYHFIDILAQVVNTNNLLKNKTPDSIRTMGSITWPEDALGQFNMHDYQRFFPNYQPPAIDLSKMGELDCHALIEFERAGKRLTQAKLSVMHNSFSRRAWPMSKADTYKGNGRLRHERLHLSIGPLLSLMVHSYAAYEEHSAQDLDVPAEEVAGGLNHFDVQIYRNSELVGGKPIETYNSEDLFQRTENSNIQDARRRIIEGFLRGDPPEAWDKQKLSVKLLSELARCAALHKTNELPISKCSYL